MPLADYAKKLLALAETLHRWIAALGALEHSRRVKVARFADQIAQTLGRAVDALLILERDPANKAAARTLFREFGRISGYLETIVGVLERHLDGRKVSGVKRRLEQLRPDAIRASLPALKADARIDRLLAAEGYFRALADSLRV
jgi:hypothetical protein